MAVEIEYASDVEAILSHRYDLGEDYWTTPDHRLIKGGPFSALECVLYLLELGMEPTDPLMKEMAQLIFSAWREDGRFKLYPKGALYPCQTANAARVLCHMGYGSDPRVQKSLQRLLDEQHKDGGLRCKKFSFGRGPETEASNPMPTLVALDGFRFTDHLNREPALDWMVEFLLEHWVIRTPLGPCHYGMGTLFMQVEYPLRSYNLFLYVYVLSFYDKAKKDHRFLEALKVLESRVVDGCIVPERVNRKLADLSFCRPNQPSELATKRYEEIKRNLKGIQRKNLAGDHEVW